MKVEELRTLVAQIPENDLRVLMVEVYKAIPPKIRDERIDKLFQNPSSPPLKNNTTGVTAGSGADLAKLSAELEKFISYACQQYYIFPNRHVPKKDQPKWRQIIKTYYHLLNGFAADPTHRVQSLALLEKLYHVLCYGCDHLIFGVPDPFPAVEITQPDFFRRLLILKNETEYKPAFIRDAVLLMLTSRLNRDTLAPDLMDIILEFLTTPDLKETTITQCDSLREEITTGHLLPEVEDANHHRRLDLTNRAVEMGFLCYLGLREQETAIIYFKQNHRDRNPELTLHALLTMLFRYRQQTYWLQEYETALQNGLEPQRSLQKAYDYILTHQEFPSHI